MAVKTKRQPAASRARGTDALKDTEDPSEEAQPDAGLIKQTIEAGGFERAPQPLPATTSEGQAPDNPFRAAARRESP